MSRFAFVRTAVLAIVVIVSFPGVARAQMIRSVAVTDYWVDYMRHAHNFADYAPNLPRFNEGTPWWRVKTLLMPGRRAHALYLLGDDRLHLYPARVGVIGWGATAALEF
jgi:hypothetical protein